MALIKFWCLVKLSDKLVNFIYDLRCTMICGYIMFFQIGTFDGVVERIELLTIYLGEGLVVHT